MSMGDKRVERQAQVLGAVTTVSTFHYVCTHAEVLPGSAPNTDLRVASPLPWENVILPPPPLMNFIVLYRYTVTHEQP